MNKLIFRKLYFDVFIFFILSSLAITSIVWIIQGINLLDIVTEQGHSFKVYFIYSFLSIPKIFSKLIIISLFLSLFTVINRYEENNEILVFWTNGIKKISFINFIFRISFIFVIIQIVFNIYIVPNTENLAQKYLNEDEVKFIKDMILGNVEDKSNPRDCLIELLNNKSSIFDLDKLDYLNRDTYYYNGIKNKINYNKFIDNMKIVSVNNLYELCYSYELKNDFDNLFSLRFENHFNIYQNVNVKKWEKSFEDKFNESNVIEKFFNDGFDIDEFCNLTDSFFKLNKCDYIILGKSFQNFQMNKISNELKNTNLLCDEYIINHGCREENPVSKIIFYLDDSVFKLINNNNRKRYQEIYKYLYYKDNKENNKNLNRFNKIYNKLSFLR